MGMKIYENIKRKKLNVLSLQLLTIIFTDQFNNNFCSTIEFTQQNKRGSLNSRPQSIYNKSISLRLDRASSLPVD